MQTNQQAGAEARYQAALNEGRFLIQRCNECHKHVFYPRMVCPHCGGASLAWVEPKGTGGGLFDHHRAAQAGGGRRL